MIVIVMVYIDRYDVIKFRHQIIGRCETEIWLVNTVEFHDKCVKHFSKHRINSIITSPAPAALLTTK